MLLGLIFSGEYTMKKRVSKAGIGSLICILAMFFIVSACKKELSRQEIPPEKENKEEPGIESEKYSYEWTFKKGELLFSDDFSSNLDNWVCEGDGTIRIRDGKLHIEAIDDGKYGTKKCVVWCKQAFEGPIIIEYTYQSLTEHGLGLFLWNALGRNGEDIFTWQRTGRYQEYIIEKMNMYHVSYNRGKTGISNLRKSYGFHHVSETPDPIPITDLETHTIKIVTYERIIRMYCDGEQTHDVIDTGRLCLTVEGWSHAKCEGIDPEPLTGGRLGFRHTKRKQALYDNVKVFRALKEKAKNTVVIDNKDAGFTVVSGTWNESTRNAGYFGENYLWNKKGSGEDAVKWTCSLPEPGKYNVYVHWVWGNGDRATNAPFVVIHKNGQDTVHLDLSNKQLAGKWIKLGIFEFSSTGEVQLSDDADNSVVADAVKFVHAD